MQTGALFDLIFDGQSSITARDAAPPVTPGGRYVGVDGWRHRLTGERFRGGFLALAPWVAPDPVATIARGLHPEDYRESVIWADLAMDRNVH